MTYNILGFDLSFSDMVESASEMLGDEDAPKSDPTACNHRVGLPHKDGYACGSCHAVAQIEKFEEVWVNLENGVVKIDMISGFDGMEISM